MARCPGDRGASVLGTFSSYRGERTPTEAMTPTVGVGQVGSARRRRERAEAKRTTAGTRTGSEAVGAGELASNSETPKSSEAPEVEPGGPFGQRLNGPKEIPEARAAGKSAEAIVAVEAERKPGRAKGRRTKERSSMRTCDTAENGKSKRRDATTTVAIPDRPSDVEAVEPRRTARVTTQPTP